MVRNFARHAVADYVTWRKGYDEMAKFREERGVMEDAVYQDVSDPNMVTVCLGFESLEAAQKFSDSQELHAKMKEIGVLGDPMIWIVRETSR